MTLPWPPAGTVPLPIDVVSVQSQVVYGRVGNNVAIPTLGAFGLSAAAVPTVAFSNTPHYATLHGGAVPVEWFEGWLDDLVARGGLRDLGAVLTGYLGNAAQSRVLAGWIRERLAERPGLRVVIDPVIGDHEQGVYVDPALVDAYRHDLLALADGLTPNDFELAHLTGRDITDVATTVAAARTLLAGRTRWVVVTSAAPGTWTAHAMQLVLVTRDTAHVIMHPRLDVEPKGTGDLFAAALTGCCLRGDALVVAAANACQHVIAALRSTRDAHCAELLLPRSMPERCGHTDVSVHEVAAAPAS
ncbi:MAG: pyridoxine/pyridoxal/pyridoxamine kinase [Rhodanobacteraceae bacterium]